MSTQFHTGPLTFVVGQNAWERATNYCQMAQNPESLCSIDQKTYNLLPDFLMIRECRVQVEKPGFRVTTLIIATTLLSADEFTSDDLAQVYRLRWSAELDLKSLKQTLQMDVLRCKTPELVRKELWTHILAYNLIRTIMAQAATKHGIEPRSISFKGTVQTLEAFQPVIALTGERDPTFRRTLYTTSSMRSRLTA